jgi:hypothetical protein
MKSNQQVRQPRVKVFAALVGGSAVVAMGALSVALPEEQAPGASGAATGTTFIQGTMTMGPTATTTTPPAAPVTSIATPPMTATTPAGFR